MHERTQRAVARLMFVFCCAVPTALTLGCIVVTWTPWYHSHSLQSIADELSRDTGLRVEIDDFRRSAPATTHLYGVRVIQPETGREVARVRQLEWVCRSDEISVFLHQPEVQSSELPGAWQMIHDRFLCRPERTTLPVRVAGNDLTIHSRTGGLPLRDVRAWIAPIDDVVEATIQCMPATSGSDTPVQVSVRRHRKGDMPSTEVRLDAAGTPLPCSALAEYLPILETLGSDAMFSGSMRFQLPTNNQWWIDLGGSRFEDVSLDRLFERQSHRLSGTASIEFERCRIEPFNQRSDVVGSLRASEGWIGRSLLVSAKEHLSFEVSIPKELIDSRDSVPYDRLAIGFQINNTQLQLHGVCRREIGYESFPPGVVLCVDLLPLVQSSNKTLDSVSLISAIAPPHSITAPLSRQTSSLMSVLIPPSRPLPRDERFAPRIRSADLWRGGPTISQPHR